MRQISSDPFARTELVRFRVEVSPTGTCDWCGGQRFTLKTHRNVLYRYATQSASGREYVHDGQFCSKSCHDSFHR